MTVHAIMVPGGLYMCMAWRLRLLVADPLLGLLPWREKAGVLFACNRPGEHGLHVRLAGSTSATIERVKRRIIGTAIGVPLGLACLLLVAAARLSLGRRLWRWLSRSGEAARSVLAPLATSRNTFLHPASVSAR
jgi:hypothetical protein